MTFGPGTHGGLSSQASLASAQVHDHLYIPCPSLPGSSLMSPTDTTVHQPSPCDPLVVYYDPMFLSASNASTSCSLQAALSTRLVHRGSLHDSRSGSGRGSGSGDFVCDRSAQQGDTVGGLDAAEVDGVVGVPGPSGGSLLVCVDDLHLTEDSSHHLLRQVVEARAWHEKVPHSGMMRFGVLGVQVCPRVCVSAGLCGFLVPYAQSAFLVLLFVVGGDTVGIVVSLPLPTVLLSDWISPQPRSSHVLSRSIHPFVSPSLSVCVSPSQLSLSLSLSLFTSCH